MKPTTFLPLLLLGTAPAAAQTARTVIHAGHLIAEPGKPVKGNDFNGWGV